MARDQKWSTSFSKIMTFFNAYQEATDWKRRVNLISFYHYIMLSRNKNWKLTDSAHYFGLSMGLISESLNLSEHWELVKECKSRNEALKRIKK
jgi:hypothetical protein